MVWYDVPIGTQKQNVSAPQMRNNFSQANVTFGVDHYAFSDETSNNGYHNSVTTPPIIGGMAPTSTPSLTILYGLQQTANLGLLQYSIGYNSTISAPSIPTPLTAIHSISTPITLARAATTNILDFTSITLAMGTVYAFDATSALNLAGNVYWNGSAFTFNINSGSGFSLVGFGNILQLKNNAIFSANNVFWTLKLHRLQ